MENKFFSPLEGFEEEITVCGVPFRVHRENKMVCPIPYDDNYYGSEGPGKVNIGKKCEALFFLGLTTRDFKCSEWWGQKEAKYDFSTRLFIGDRVGRLDIVYEDDTEDLIPLLFGVNLWNYDLFEPGKPWEQGLMPFNGPYREPFESDPKAAKLFSNCLRLMENTTETAEKATKWVMGVKTSPHKTVRQIFYIADETREAGVNISSVTALLAGNELDPAWTMLDLDFFLGKKYYKAAYELSHRLYQYKDELPEHDPLADVPGYDGPKVTFSGDRYADIYTNVYRVNMMDMAYQKVDDEGGTHTSSPGALNFGCYIGMGTFNQSEAYGDHIWTRDIGRLLMEIIDAGYFDRAKIAVDDLHKWLYADSKKYKHPHWKRIANHNFDSIQGKENDGHAAVMLAIYTLYNKGAVDDAWLAAHKQHLIDAGDWFVWQVEHPEESNFDRVLFSESETSTQTHGGYDLFSSIIASEALKCYAKLLNIIGEGETAKNFVETAELLYRGCCDRFMMDHPLYGDVFCDTTDDCWTWEYKRFVLLLLQADVLGYDVAWDDPALFEFMDRTFLAQKESVYEPEAGRQMGYGQGYLTQAALLLDRFDEATDCVQCAAAFCYHHTDRPYIVPEGVIIHGSRRFWYRNSDLGNGVQQAETIKNARLVIGIDDISKNRGLRLVPRMPLTWDKIEAEAYPICANGKKLDVSFTYQRDGEGYRMAFSCPEPVEVDFVRFGPFAADKTAFSVSGAENYSVKTINGRNFVYVPVGEKTESLAICVK